MSRQTDKRPRFINILLKKTAVLVMVMIVITIITNYIASKFFEMAFAASQDTYIDDLSGQLDNADYWDVSTDYNKLKLKLAIGGEEEIVDGLRYIRVIDMKTGETIADSTRRGMVFIRPDEEGGKYKFYTCDLNLLGDELLSYETVQKTVFTYSLAKGRVISDYHYLTEDYIYYTYMMNDVYLKDNTFLPGKIDVVENYYDEMKDPVGNVIKTIDLTPDDTSGYEHYTDGCTFLIVGTPADSYDLIKDRVEMEYTDMGTSYYIGINDGSLFGSVLCITSRIFTDEDSHNYLIQCFARSSYQESIGIIIKWMLIPVYIMAFIILLIASFLSYKKRLGIYEHEENRRTLMNAMAHDLKSPLMAIRGYAENLEEDVNSDKREHYVDSILKNSDYMNTLITGNLDLLKLEYNTEKTSNEKLELVSLSSDLLEKYRASLDDRKIKVITEGTYNIKANGAQMNTAMENLISNAVKYVNDNGEIKITGNRKGFSISNSTESDLKDMDHKELWKAFVKGDESRSNEKGSGLGLAIAKNVFDRHRIKATIKTEQVNGHNTFVVLLKSK